MKNVPIAVKVLIKYGLHGLRLYKRLRKSTDLAKDEIYFKLRFFLRIGDDVVSTYIDNASAFKSQILQDLFVLSELGLKQGGFFVEFGAANGIEHSNSYVHEKLLGWSGILAEPARCWHDALKTNRGAHIETDCVWSESGKTLAFQEVSFPALSTIAGVKTEDFHTKTRKNFEGYEVRTISLIDLMKKHGAPPVADYLSIDTEGSELEILRSLDFVRYRFRVITCEHNFTPQREEIFDLLTSKGYQRKHEEYSGFDDWYVLVNN